MVVVMGVEVRLYGSIRDAVGESVLSVDAESVESMLRHLEDTHPGLGGVLLEVDDIAESVVIAVNGTDVRHLDGLATGLDDGDVIRITKNAYPRR